MTFSLCAKGDIINVRRHSGTCPLTSNVFVGAFFGGLVGLVAALAFIRPAGPIEEANLDAPVIEKAETTAEATAELENVGPELAVVAPEILHISDRAEFQSVVLEARGVVLVDLWATWCGPCRIQAPILETVAASLGANARIVKLDVDEVPDVASELRVEAIPTLVLFRDGKEVKRFVGVQTAETLSKALEA